MTPENHQGPEKEHEELCEELAAGTEAGRITGPAAGTLTVESTGPCVSGRGCAPLSRSLRYRQRQKASAEMQTALTMADRLRIELEQMIEDHKTAVDNLRRLSEKYARLARKMR